MSAPKVNVMPLLCPFCGESPTVQPWHGGGPEKRLIGCENEDCHANPSVTGETLDTAVSRWNQRVMPAAVAELIEREKVATQVFDCILRGVNDLSGPMGYRSEQFVASWLESWAKSLNAAGFKPSNPEATDIARALARIGGAA